MGTTKLLGKPSRQTLLCPKIDVFFLLVQILRVCCWLLLRVLADRRVVLMAGVWWQAGWTTNGQTIDELITVSNLPPGL